MEVAAPRRLAARRIHLGLVLLVAFVLVGVPVALVSAARSAGQPGGAIAFTRADGIYVIRADGRGMHPIRRGGVAAGALALAWSPDGRKLAFTDILGRGLWTMNADGTHLVRLVTADAISAATLLGPLTWSPGKIGFTASDGSRSDIWVVNANGAKARPLARTTLLDEFEVDWSPTANRIAFTVLDGKRPGPLYVMNSSGKRNIRNLNPGWKYNSAMPDWSPDGRRLAFMRWQLSVLDGEIWTTSAGTGMPVRLTRNAVRDSNPVWSPDGRKIAFLRGGSRPSIVFPPPRRSSSEIYVMNANGTGVKRLTHNRVGEGSPAWQPGGP